MSNKQQFIKIRGARTHNLKSIDVDIPLNKITCIGGPSGSGKSSLAFHTITNESKRRFLNSMSTNVKFFSQKPAAVDVDEMSPVLPVFALPQINPIIGSRAVVADTMGLTELFGHLFYKYSYEVCPKHKSLLEVPDFNDEMKTKNKLKKDQKIHVFLKKKDFLDIFINSPLPTRVWDNEKKEITLYDEKANYWEIARVKFPNTNKLIKIFDDYSVLKTRDIYYYIEGAKEVKKLKLGFIPTCPKCSYQTTLNAFSSYFSPYNALGACQNCNGFGSTLEFDETKLLDKELSIKEGAALFLNYKPFSHLITTLEVAMKKKKIPLTKPVKDIGDDIINLLYEGGDKFPGYNSLFKYLERKKYKRNVRIYLRRIQKEEDCTVCFGSRLKQEISQRVINVDDLKISFSQLCLSTINEARSLLSSQKKFIDSYHEKLTSKLKLLLDVAIDIGLGNVSLMRKTKSLSAGEYQRFLLLKFIAFEGTNSLFVFDEPSLGLGEFEQKKLLDGIKRICEQGNTIILVDHSKFFQKSCDQLMIMGPGAGGLGGNIVFDGQPVEYFQNEKTLDLRRVKSQLKNKKISIKNLKIRNFNIKKLEIPIGAISWIHGRAGTGKTSCFVHGLANIFNYKLNHSWLYDSLPEYSSFSIPKEVKDVKVIESNLNRYTSRSSVGSITELFSIVRKHFLNTPYAKSLGLKDGHLSANSELGQCSECEGKGVNIIEMQYLEDIILECEVCRGRKLKPHLSEISDGELMVYEAYSMPLHELMPRLRLTPKFQRIWEYIKILKLDYLSLDRGVSSLSGGEKQRIYLLSCLIKKLENTVLFFENLSFGLSDLEMEGICEFLQSLLLSGNTVVLLDSNKNFQKICHFEVEFSDYGQFKEITH